MSWMLPREELDVLAAAVVSAWPRERTEAGEALGKALLNDDLEELHIAARVDWRAADGTIAAVSYWVEHVGVRVQVEREWAPATREERRRCSLRSGPPTDSQRQWASALLEERAKMSAKT